MPYIGKTNTTFTTFTSSDVKVTDDLTVTDDASVGGNLTVTGNVDVDGILETDNLTINGSQGTDGQVLTSTGSGVGWEAAGSGAMTLIADYTPGNTTTNGFSITNCFSSTYDNYLMLVSAWGDTDSQGEIYFKLIDSSGVYSGDYLGVIQTGSTATSSWSSGGQLGKIYMNRNDDTSGGKQRQPFVMAYITLNNATHAGFSKISMNGVYSRDYNELRYIFGGHTHGDYSGTPTGLNVSAENVNQRFDSSMHMRIFGYQKSV